MAFIRLNLSTYKTHGLATCGHNTRLDSFTGSNTYRFHIYHRGLDTIRIPPFLIVLLISFSYFTLISIPTSTTLLHLLLPVLYSSFVVIYPYAAYRVHPCLAFLFMHVSHENDSVCARVHYPADHCCILAKAGGQHFAMVCHRTRLATYLSYLATWENYCPKHLTERYQTPP